MTADPVIIGVDPGGRYTGLIAAVATPDGLGVVTVAVLDRRKLPGPLPGPSRALDITAWLEHVGDAIAATRARLLADLFDFSPFDIAAGAGDSLVRVAVEDCHAPNPHVRRRDGNSLTNVTGILDTAKLVGYLCGRFADLILVPPAGNGAMPDSSYPPPIRRGARLGGPSDHARSAYDVARYARLMSRARTGAHRP